MNGIRDQHVKWNKPVSQTSIACSLICGSQGKTDKIKSQDHEHKIMTAGEEEGGKEKQKEEENKKG
jgi:hypothetical protein